MIPAMHTPSLTDPTWLYSFGQGVHAIDTGYGRDAFDAAWLLIDPRSGRAAFIDTGHNAAVPRLLEALSRLGLNRESVDWVIPTHVHLDHAGGAGLLMSWLPQARALIHPQGARHLIDPSALMAGTRAVYGPERTAALYGEVLPIAAERVISSEDGMTIALGQRQLRLIHTPGHARHHHVVWDADSRSLFSGDAFGISYPEFDDASGQHWGFPSCTPVQFDPAAMVESIRRMLALAPEALCPTHFGRIAPTAAVQRHAQQVLDQIDRLESGAVALSNRSDSATPDDLTPALAGLVETVMLDAACAAGSPRAQHDRDRARELLANDIGLNAQGIAVWLSRRSAQRPSAG